MDELKTYSVLIAWNDNDDEQGEFGDIVRAKNPEHAERIVRARMLRQEWEKWSRIDKGMSKSEVADMFAHDNLDGSKRYFGRLLDLQLGAIWKAYPLEAALRLAVRALVAVYGEPGPEPLPLDSALGRTAILEGRKILEEIDQI